jgi:2,4-dienoyl-CoA reductase-like NADH-dependent reductase (Old Yellow Enzyme family)
MDHNEAYPHLFAPFLLAGKSLKNRIVHAAIAPHFGAEHGIKEGQIHYYANRAKGGAGMVVTEPVVIAPHQNPHRVCAWNDSMVDDLSRWADAVEREDCRLLAQVQDPGRGRHIPGRNYGAIGASALPDDLSWTVPHALTISEIRAFIDSAAQSAARLKRCGFSGVEVSSGHGHLFHQFLSPRSNQREDEYGGDLEGRARLLVQLCAAIRSACGRDFILGVKLPGDDGIADSITPALAAQIATHLVASVPVDYLTYAQGTHNRTLEMHIPDGSYPRVPYLPLIRELRKATPRVPVIALGRITDPAEAEGILARGDIELVGLGRALISDAAWPIKAQEGRARDIRYCVSGNTCWKTVITGKPIVCDNNPRVSLPDEVGYKPPPAQMRKRVVIVGAGIAGLEAAWTAAARGHEVTIFGSSPEPGGKTRLQACLPISESLSSIYDYQIVAAQKAGARFELGITATAEDILALAPDVVVLATGSTMTWPVCLPQALKTAGIVPDLRAAMRQLVGRRERQHGAAVIFDMDQGDGTYAAAELLRDLFDRVVILTPREHIAEETALATRQRILRRFHERAIEFKCLVEPRWTLAFENEGRLEYASIFGGETTSIDDVSFFAYSTPRAPNDELTMPLRAAGVAVHLVGDCKVARGALEATAEGHAIGTML